MRRLERIEASVEEAAPITLDPVEIVERTNLPTDYAEVATASGRRYEITAGDLADRLVIRGRTGEVVLRIEVGDRGPTLTFSSADIVIEGSRAIELTAESIAVRTRGDLTMDIGGHHHTRVAGDERLEAQGVELQANDKGVAIKAMEAIRLDGEHIGLNDDPAPAPFAWSRCATEEEP